MFIDAEELLPTPPPTPTPPMPSPSPPSSYEGKIMPLGHLQLSIRDAPSCKMPIEGTVNFRVVLNIPG